MLRVWLYPAKPLQWPHSQGNESILFSDKQESCIRVCCLLYRPHNLRNHLFQREGSVCGKRQGMQCHQFFLLLLSLGFDPFAIADVDSYAKKIALRQHAHSVFHPDPRTILAQETPLFADKFPQSHFVQGDRIACKIFSHDQVDDIETDQLLCRISGQF